jgi:predicted transcriptional regulator
MTEQNLNAFANNTLSNTELVEITAEISTAYISRNSISIDQIPELLQSIYQVLNSLQQSEPVVEAKVEAQKPFVSIKKSITDDYLICLEDGKQLKMLKRHLRTAYGMTPEDYRAKWSLPADYPMVAKNYAERRSHFARQIGLGRTADSANKKAKQKAA